jgi:hypothetical protein
VIPSGIECFYFFALMQKSNKKDQSAAADEILNISLKSRNSREELVTLKGVLAQTALIF